MTKQCYIHSSFNIVLCLSLHVHDCVENVLKCFYVHDIKVMIEEIGLKFPENTLLYPIIGQTKIRKLLLTGLETKHNITVLWHHVIQFFTTNIQGATSFTTIPTKKSYMFFLYPWSISKKRRCCDVAVTQINYPSLNKQDSIEQARGRFHEEGTSQDFYAIWYEI